MRKYSILFLLCILLILPVSAAAQSYVFDEAGLFTAEEAQDLNDWAQEISEYHNFGVYIHTVQDFTDGGYTDVFQYAKDFYISNNLGKGSGKDGAMLMLSMADHDYQLLFNGYVSDMAFTETGRDDMERHFLDGFRRGDFAGGFKAYLSDCDSCLTAYEAGTPIGSGTDHSATGYIPYYEEEPQPRSFNLLVSLIPGLIAAAITGIALSVPMRSAKEKRDAAGYTEGSVHLTRRQDLFLHRSVMRTPKSPPPSSGGGSGGSFHSSSGSFSGRSGKF